MTFGHIHFLPRRLWRVEKIEGYGGPYGIFSRESSDQYVILGLDREQADFAVMLLENDAIGDASQMEAYDVRVELQHQVERRFCLRCSALGLAGSMDQDGRCQECQP